MTIEAAIALTIVVVMLAACLSGIGCAIAQVNLVDAAREAARLAARGEADAATAAAEQIGPDGTTLRLEYDENLVTATVSATPIGGLLPGVELSATAVAALELGVSDADADS